MNNLTTRKIVLGLLMTLVLAFGVPSIAGAIGVKPVSLLPQVTTQTFFVGGSNSFSFTVQSRCLSTGKESVKITATGGVQLIAIGASGNSLSATSFRLTEKDAPDGTNSETLD